MGVGIPQEFIQIGATLYEVFYCDDSEQGADCDNEANDEEEDEVPLGERISLIPAYRPLLQSFPTKEDTCGSQWLHLVREMQSNLS